MLGLPKREEKMKEKLLILMVGLPRSGKTTIAQKMGFPVVNPDSVRLALHGDNFIVETERMVWTIVHYMVESLFLAGHNTVVLDATNTTKKRRAEWFSDRWNTTFVLLDTPKEECLRRAMDGGRMDLVPVIEQMSAEYEAPDIEEGFILHNGRFLDTIVD